MTDADASLAATSRRQFGAFSRTQATDAGVPRTTLDSRLVSGRYRRLLPGVLAEAATPDSWEARAMAALLYVGGESALARFSAARVHGLDVARPGDDRIAVVVQSRTFPDTPAIRVHRTRRLDADDVVQVGPLSATSVTRTLCDLAGSLDPGALRRGVASAVRAGGTDATTLRLDMARLGRFRGRVALTRLVDELSPLDRDCRSALETAFLRLMRGTGLPPTAMNVPVIDIDGRRRVLDAVYLPERVPIELDSRRHHGTLLDWHDDLRRENAVVLTGYRDFLRFSWQDVTEHPGEVVARVQSALDRARVECAPERH